jgi:predicted nucleic acid-binding protein
MMANAYVDASVLLAVSLGEPAGPAVRQRLMEFTVLLSAPLLEAELRAAWRREGVAPDTALLGEVAFTTHGGSLSAEIQRVLDAGYLRGADCWHLATALHLDPGATRLTFLTLDERQRAVAEDLGFRT